MVCGTLTTGLEEKNFIKYADNTKYFCYISNKHTYTQRRNSMNKTFKEGIEKGAEQLAQSVRETLPKVQFNKNGYEIRTNVLDMAKSFTEFSYSNKWIGWEVTAKRDEKSGQIINKVDMPEIPGVDQVLETAEKFYDFINTTKK